MNNLTKTITTSLKTVIAGFVLVSAGIDSCHSQDYSNVAIYESLLNHEINPIGIDAEKPDFSWKLKSESRKRYQKAYQIIVWSENTTDTC